MRRTRSLPVVGTVILLVGVIMTLFGTVYFISFDLPAPTTAYYLCPIWYVFFNVANTPTFNAGNCIRLTGPALLFPFVNLSSFPEVNYLPNFIGIVLILLGVAVVVRGYGQHPTLNISTDHPKRVHHLRPIYWGVISFFIGLVGWRGSSELYALLVHPTILGATSPLGRLIGLPVIAFVLVWLFSLPVAAIAEVVRWQRRRMSAQK